MGGSVTDNEREQTDESSQTEKSDAEKHYYENGLKEYQKPQVENAKEETQTEIPDEKTMGGSVTDNERERIYQHLFP